MSEFKCPECGSKMFGTTDCVKWVNPRGHCHGFKSDGSRCGFTWCRKTQDDDVFENDN
jgi:hypothetical protein